MIRALILAATILISATAASQEGEEDALFRALGYGGWAVQIGDIVSTELLLRNGWEEQNPLWKNDAHRRFIGYPMKIGLAWALNEATARIYPRNRIVATLIRAGIVSAYSVVLANNLQLSMTVRF